MCIFHLLFFISTVTDHLSYPLLCFTGRLINYWLEHHFYSKTSRARCLVIIGPSGVGKKANIRKTAHFCVPNLSFLTLKLGKTSFALSLPGRVNYFKGTWSLSNWHNKARYMVIDDVPWDAFEKRYFPSQKAFLTCDEDIFVSILLLEYKYVSYLSHSSSFHIPGIRQRKGIQTHCS